MSERDGPDPAERFTDRVDDYVAFRPSYPAQLIDFLRAELDLRPDHTIADIGSGPGTLSRLFLANGNRVFGVEPNAAMRSAAERSFAEDDRFLSIAGRAEETSLETASVDFVVAGQAFHWFELEKTRREFARILKPGGRVVLIWNHRRTHDTPFARAYEDFLRRWGTDYEQVSRRWQIQDALEWFFAPTPYRERSFESRQSLDFVGLRGRLLSSSYIPGAEHPDREPMMVALRELFDAHARGGEVVLDYDTVLYYGLLA